MKIDQTPTLLNSDYTRAQTLRAEVARVISFRDKPSTSATGVTAINTFLTAVAGATIPPTSAVVANGAAVTVRSSGNTTIVPDAVAVVSAGALSGVRMPTSYALVQTATKFPGVTGTGTFATITVTNGQITGIALSAS